MVYLLPEDIISKYPTLRKIPRWVREVVYDENMLEVVESEQFLDEIMDAVSALTFPHFGFRGWKEHYTGYCPVWKLSYSLPIWARVLNDEIQWDLQAMFFIPIDSPIPFFNSDYIVDLMSRVVKRAIDEENWQPILDVIKEMPCDEDFVYSEKNKSWVRSDFERRWYHTRSKKVKTISLDECLEDDEHGVFYVEDKSAHYEDNVIVKDFTQRFMARLSDKDLMILELRYMGFTYKEIAERLGYTNHSGVIKRITAIRKEFENYENARQ